MSKMDVQLILSQITQLQGTLMALEARVSALENGGTAGGTASDPQGMGPGWSIPRNIIGVGDGGDLKGTPDSESDVVRGSLCFRSADDANVVVRTIDEPAIDGEESYDGTIEIGVYYV